MLTLDPLEPNSEWLTPKLSKHELINRNFLFAHDMISEQKANKSNHLEFVFYDFVQNQIIVVEPIEILSLLEITAVDAGDGRYLTVVITFEDWVNLKPYLIYLGVV